MIRFMIPVSIQSVILEILKIELQKDMIGNTEKNDWRMILTGRGIDPTPEAINQAHDFYGLKIRNYHAAIKMAKDNLLSKTRVGSNRLIQMPDNSMFPRFRKGDTLCYDDDAKPAEGKPCLVSFMSMGGYLVRRFHQDGPTIRLTADNEDYPELVLTPADNVSIHRITAQGRSL